MVICPEEQVDRDEPLAAFGEKFVHLRRLVDRRRLDHPPRRRGVGGPRLGYAQREVQSEPMVGIVRGDLPHIERRTVWGRLIVLPAHTCLLVGSPRAGGGPISMLVDISDAESSFAIITTQASVVGK
jgi:hypothetical protein